MILKNTFLNTIHSLLISSGLWPNKQMINPALYLKTANKIKVYVCIYSDENISKKIV